MLFVFGVVSAGRDLFERLAAFGENGGGARLSFIAADDDVNMKGIAHDTNRCHRARPFGELAFAG
jgi:hypothetical protein